jgi:hypothetical protein
MGGSRPAVCDPVHEFTLPSPSGRGLRARESHGLATERCQDRSSHAGLAAAAAGRHIALGESTDSKSTRSAPPRPTIDVSIETTPSAPTSVAARRSGASAFKPSGGGVDTSCRIGPPWGQASSPRRCSGGPPAEVDIPEMVSHHERADRLCPRSRDGCVRSGGGAFSSPDPGEMV